MKKLDDQLNRTDNLEIDQIRHKNLKCDQRLERKERWLDKFVCCSWKNQFGVSFHTIHLNKFQRN